MHLLVIEDERALCETIVRSLRRLAYSVDYCYDGEKALALLGVERYDLVLLDLNLPKKDGMTVLRTLRQTDRETRVLILSARSEVEDKVEGLDAGANDYLAKPFHLAELEARIRSLTLRQFTQQDVLLTCGDLTFRAPDMDAFPCLRIARQCAKAGGTACAIMNGANEAAVALFLQERIGFNDIPRLVESALSRVEVKYAPDLPDILEADRQARAAVLQTVGDMV